MDAARLDRSLRLSITEGALATAMGTLLSGVFLTGFALTLGASRLQIGVLAALPALANLAQIPGSLLLERRGHRKLLCVGTTLASRLLWLPALLLPVILAGQSANVVIWALVALLAVSNCLGSIGGVAWLSWIRDLVPGDRRPFFLSRRNQIDTALALMLSVAGALFIDGWNAFSPGSIQGYSIVLLAAVVCGIVGIPILNAIPDHGLKPQPRKPLVAMLRQPVADKNFRRLISFYAMWNFATNLVSPFFVVVMIERLSMPIWYITLLATLSSIASVWMSPFWARMTARFGIRPVIGLATLIDAIIPLAWLAVSPQYSWLLLPIHLLGFANSALALGPNNLVLKLAPQQTATPYMAVFQSVIGPVGAMAAVLGGALISFADVWTLPAGIAVDPLLALFGISALARVGSLLLLQAIEEPESSSMSALVRSLCPSFVLGSLKAIAAWTRTVAEPGSSEAAVLPPAAMVLAEAFQASPVIEQCVVENTPAEAPLVRPPLTIALEPAEQTPSLAL